MSSNVKPLPRAPMHRNAEQWLTEIWLGNVAQDTIKNDKELSRTFAFLPRRNRSLSFDTGQRVTVERRWTRILNVRKDRRENTERNTQSCEVKSFDDRPIDRLHWASTISRPIVIVDRSINRSLRSLTTIEETDFINEWLKSNLPIVRVILRFAFSFG